MLHQVLRRGRALLPRKDPRSSEAGCQAGEVLKLNRLARWSSLFVLASRIAPGRHIRNRFFFALQKKSAQPVCSGATGIRRGNLPLNAVDIDWTSSVRRSIAPGSLAQVMFAHLDESISCCSCPTAACSRTRFSMRSPVFFERWPAEPEYQGGLVPHGGVERNSG